MRRSAKVSMRCLIDVAYTFLGRMLLDFVATIWVNETGAWHPSVTMNVSTEKVFSSRC